MGEYEKTLRIQANQDGIFDFVCDITNMPKYLPTVHRVELTGEERVRVQGEARGRPYDSDGFLKIDPIEYHMEWGSDGDNRYRGWLDVEDIGGASDITVHLSFTPRPDLAQKMEPMSGGHDTAIEQGMESALNSIKNIVEGHGIKVEPATANEIGLP